MTAIKLTLQIIWVLSLLAIPAAQGGMAQSAPKIVLLTPTEGSTVISPIEIRAEMSLGDASLLRVALTNGQNNVLSRQLHYVSAPGDEPFDYTASLPFEIPTESTPALLSLMLIDKQNRPICVRSSALTLQSSGNAVSQTAAPVSPWLGITTPEPDDLITGGEIQVTGEVTPLTGNPVIFDLYSDSGRILVTMQLAVEQPGTAVDFSLTIPYVFNSEQLDALLVIRQSASSFNGTIILDSLPLKISP